MSHHFFVPGIGIVADDLTGACDSGVEFLTCSSSVLVMVEASAVVAPEPQKGIVLYNTQSRRLPPEEAYGAAFDAGRRALASGADLIFKKVDSALRGNFGVEIGAVMDAARASVAFILPAIPEAGRETIGGVQHIDGVPVAESFYSRDPEHPVVESSVLVRAEEGSGRKAGLVSLDAVRAGRTVETVEQRQKEGCQLIVVDASSASDLHNAVGAVMPMPQRKIFVGCQGLAEALAGQLGTGERPCKSLGRMAGPALYICATLHPQSARQLQLAAESQEVVLLDAEAACITDRSRSAVFLRNLVQACQRELRRGRHVAVRVCGEPTGDLSRFCDPVLDFLSDLTCQVVSAAPPGALVLTGGETAYSVCRALGIRTLKLHARISPLVVASRVVGGACDDMVVITKGGSIGPDDVVSRIHDFLTGGE